MREREPWRAAHRLLGILWSAVQRCIDPDKKVAVQLSGGLDSSIVQAIANCPNIYCCTWPDMDHARAANLATLGHHLREVTFTREEMIAVLPKVKELTGGQGTWSQVCQWYLAKAMAEDGVEIVLNGEGADELFYGYSRYRVLWWIERIYADHKLAMYQPYIERILGGKRQDILTRLLGPGWGDIDPSVGLVETAARHDGNEPLRQLLDFERAIAAAHGIEHRHPFMDDRVVEFARGLHISHLIDEDHSKLILRRVGHLLNLDARIIEEQTKKGLVIPQSWRPEGEPMWSRAWFDQLMEQA